MASIISASTTSATALNLSGDTTGILQLATGAVPTTAVTIDASQNVGIGVTPSTWASGYKTLEIGALGNAVFSATSDTWLSNNIIYTGGSSFKYGYTAAASAYEQTSGLHVFYGAASGTAGASLTLLERMRIDASGNVLVATTSQFGSGLICSVYDSASKAGFAIKQSNNLVGTFGAFYNYTGALQGYINNNNNGTVSYVTTSDYRLKENIAPLTNALNTVSKLKPSKYNFIGYDQKMTGFIAHELQEILPEAVSGEKDAVNEDGTIKPQGIDTSFLVATLTAAIQELKAIIDTQQTRITALEAK